MKAIIDYIKRIFKSIPNTDVPELIKTKYFTLLITAAVIPFIGIIAYFFTGKNLITIPTSIVLGLMVAAYGIYFKFTVLEYGYIVKKGMCIDHFGEAGLSMGSVWVGKSAGSVAIETEDEIIALPVTPKNVPPVGAIVEIYVSPESQVYNINGKNNYSIIYGYSIAPEKNILEQ